LVFADLDALGAWRHHESLDGKADVVFWGRDAADLAGELGVDELPEADGVYGWVDVASEEATALVDRLRGRSVRGEVRPHSHHHAVLKQVWSSPIEVGLADVGAATVFGFMTTRGDGVFPVYRELDRNGSLVRLTVEF